MKLHVAALFLGAATVSADAADLPPHHPPTHPTLAKFSQHFRCPYANEWVTKGPHQAAIDLGLVGSNNKNSTTSLRNMMPSRHLRSLQDTAPAQGHCTFTNTWTGAPSCVEFRGTDYTEADMETRCAEEQDSTLTVGSGCMMTDAAVGWCLVGMPDGAMEASPMVGDCGQNQMACESFMNGVFDGDCSGAAGGENAAAAGEGPPPYDVPADTNGDVTCRIAPGAIGAGHQAGYSTGYSSTCPGTPAEGSPYMWPMAWRAHVECT
ncbi:MAG: hypothetical protein SGARI_000282 [Bacillariaceae sp.]